MILHFKRKLRILLCPCVEFSAQVQGRYSRNHKLESLCEYNECHLCGKNFSHFPNLTVLKCTSVGVKSYKFSKYGNAFMNHFSLENHVRSHLVQTAISLRSMDKPHCHCLSCLRTSLSIHKEKTYVKCGKVFYCPSSFWGTCQRSQWKISIYMKIKNVGSCVSHSSYVAGRLYDVPKNPASWYSHLWVIPSLEFVV